VSDQIPDVGDSGWPARPLAAVVAGATAIAGAAAAWHYSAAGLALAHFDARAHLVVARRILDSLMPGWQQIGAVWLPLPHLLNMLPVQVDAWYRTGASAIAISVLSMAAAAWGFASLVMRTTGSASAAVAGAALLMANPNVLYVQSTPMTEPLLFGTTIVSVALVARWIDEGATGAPHAAGWALVAACLTRYEAWPVSAALVALAGVLALRLGRPAPAALKACATLAAYPAIATLLFMANSRWTTGYWLISSGFYVPENDATGKPALAWEQVLEGVHALSGDATMPMAYLGTGLLVVAFFRSRAHASLALVLALAGAAALPLYAYTQGHPVRVRYSLPLVVACAVISAAGIATLPRRLRAIAALIAVGLTLRQGWPVDHSVPLVTESQRDAGTIVARMQVTEYLRQHYDGRLVMMSMGSLGHYMHDLSHVGLDIRDFLQEGNGEVWVEAMRVGPRGHVGWVAVEQFAEGGDGLFHKSVEDPAFLDGFERVAEGGGVVLYRARSGPH
jgi:hypothetical protein